MCQYEIMASQETVKTQEKNHFRLSSFDKWLLMVDDKKKRSR